MSSLSDRKYFYLLTLLSPISGVYYAVKDLTWAHRKPILILAITLFGATITLRTSDGYVLLQMVYDHYVGLSFGQWIFELKEMLLFSPEPGTKGDVFSHISSYLMGQVLGIPGQYFVFVSFVYGYFYVSALEKVLRWDRSLQRSLLFWVAIVVFVGYRFIDDLQTVRTWTGLWVLFNGVFGYHQTGKSKYLLLMLAAPLFHVAYFAMALPAYLVVFVKKLSPKIFVTVYFLSFMMNVAPASIIEKLKSTELGEAKVAGYYREDINSYNSTLQDNSSNWYKRYGKGWALPNAPHVLAVGLILLGLYSRRNMSRLEIGLFSTGILMATMANFGDFVPAFYNRTMVNAGIYITATTVILLIRGELFNTVRSQLRSRKRLIWIGLLSFAPYMVFVLANMLQFTSVYMMALPIFGMVAEVNMSLREFIGFFL